MLNTFLFIILGLVAGVFSGLIGIGGAIIMVPALVLLFGLSQHIAQGTTLAAMVPPIGLLAALTYYKAGLVDLKVAGLICIGFFVGGLFGAKLGVGLSEPVLRRLFGVVLLMVSLKMILTK